jgi:hypothetical protein
MFGFGKKKEKYTLSDSFKKFISENDYIPGEGVKKL